MYIQEKPSPSENDQVLYYNHNTLVVTRAPFAEQQGPVGPRGPQGVQGSTGTGYTGPMVLSGVPEFDSVCAKWAVYALETMGADFQIEPGDGGRIVADTEMQLVSPPIVQDTFTPLPPQDSLWLSVRLAATILVTFSRPEYFATLHVELPVGATATVLSAVDEYQRESFSYLKCVSGSADFAYNGREITGRRGSIAFEGRATRLEIRMPANTVFSISRQQFALPTNTGVGYLSGFTKQLYFPQETMQSWRHVQFGGVAFVEDIAEVDPSTTGCVLLYSEKLQKLVATPAEAYFASKSANS